MNNGELLVSPRVLNYIFLILLYTPIYLVAYKWLFPHLFPTAKRIANAFLAAQVLVVIVWLEIRPASGFEEWLWNLDQGGKIQSILAFTQHVMVGGVAVTAAWLARSQPAWQRFYLIGVGLVFLYLGLDDFFEWRSYVNSWLEEPYLLVGIVVVVVTITIAIRSPRRARIRYLCLLTGLLLLGMGGFAVDDLPDICGYFGFLHIDGCLIFRFLEESLEFLGTWLTLIAIFSHFSDIAPTPRIHIRLILYVGPVLWVLLLFLTTFFPYLVSDLELQFFAQPATVEFASGVHLHAYRIDIEEDTAFLRLYTSTQPWRYRERGYSVHLVDQASSNSVASQDTWTDDKFGFLQPASHKLPIFRHYVEVQIPPQAATNRALWVVLTVWREKDGEYVHQRVLASDRQLLDDTQVVLGELVLPAASAAPPAVPLARFDNGFALDAVDLPERAQPGETLSISFTWRSNTDGHEDHVQFLHFRHEASGDWWVYDQQPLGLRLPTRLWYNGLVDRETWQVSLPADLVPGRYTIFTGLYRQSDVERVPASDADETPFLDARVPLGSLIVE